METIEHFPSFKKQILALAKEWLNGKQAFHLQTSGSSVKPKKLTFSRDQIRKSIHQTMQTFNLRGGDKLLNPLSINYVAGFMMLMRGLNQGMPVYCVEPTRTPIPNELGSERFDFTALVPLQLKSLLENGYHQFLNTMKSIIIGGGPLNPGLEEKISTLSIKVFHTYGMTETLTHVAIRRITPDPQDYYQSLAGNFFEQGENEQLIIHTPLWDQPIDTNDRVELLDAHHFRWLGRLDRVVNSGGYKVQTEKTESKIEAKFIKHWGKIPEFFLYGQLDQEYGERLILVIKTDQPLSKEDKSNFLQELRGYLPSYEIPKSIIDIRRFRYTHTGKLDRKTTFQMIDQSN